MIFYFLFSLLLRYNFLVRVATISENPQKCVAGSSLSMVNPKYFKSKIPQKKHCGNRILIGRKSPCGKKSWVPSS